MTLQPLRSDPSQLFEVRCFAGGPFAENGYLVRCTATDRVAVIDPGASTPEIIDVLRRRDLIVEAIYLTHAHVDHVEGIPAIRRFTPAPIHLHPADLPIYERAEESAALFGLSIDGPLPLPEAALVPGEAVSIGDRELEVRFTPGHAPGHVVFYSAEASFALVGDVIFRASIGRTDLPGGDFLELMASIRSEVLTLPDETRLFPGHGEPTTVRDERLGNPFLISQAPGRLA